MGYDPWFPAHRFWSSVASSGRTSNQSVLSISAYETHFPTYNKTISSIPPPASSSGVGSSGDISNKQAGADIWEPRHSRSRTYQRTQSFRLHPGLVTLDTLDKEQHCCTIQWSLWSSWSSSSDNCDNYQVIIWIIIQWSSVDNSA